MTFPTMLPRRIGRAALVAALLVGTAGFRTGAALAADDPMRASQWALDTIGADPATGRVTGAGVTVAVIDSGIDVGHEDLVGAVTDTINCIGAAGDPGRCRAGGGDTDGHGTHVAGIIGARAGNGKGIAGVAPGSSILSVKVLERGCENPGAGGVVCTATGDSADVEAGMRWAIARGARVLNLSVSDDSVGRAVLGSPLAAAITDAWRQGVIVVIAAGNDLDVAGRSGYEKVPALVVAATDPGDDKPAYSNSVGTAQWGIAAPGGDDEGACPSAAVLSTWLRSSPPNTDYACLDGTSMAAPHVAGAAALLLSAGFDPAETVDQLLTTARDIGAPGHDAAFGAGRLDVGRALALPPPPERAVESGSTGAVAASSPSLATAGAPPAGRTSGAPTTRAPAGTPVTGTPSTGPAVAPGEVADDERVRGRRASPAGRDGGPSPPWLLVVLALLALAANAGALVTTETRRGRADSS